MSDQFDKVKMAGDLKKMTYSLLLTGARSGLLILNSPKQNYLLPTKKKNLPDATSIKVIRRAFSS